MNPKRHAVFSICAATAVLISLTLAVNLSSSKKRNRLVQLADGRVLEIEAVTFGSNHHLGSHLFAEDGLLSRLSDKFKIPLALGPPFREMHYQWPVLMVWVNAVPPEDTGVVSCHFVISRVLPKRAVCFDRDNAGNSISPAGLRRSILNKGVK